MLYLAFIFHMHQPYYKNLLNQESELPWVRLHGVKDYLDMVKILAGYPKIHQTFNVVPSLLEQVEDYARGAIKDRFLELSYKKADTLTADEKDFIKDNFFMINRDTVIALSARYYELYFKKQKKIEFSAQDYLDLQVWFNLAWIDPIFRDNISELKNVVNKARFFNEEDKRIVLEKQVEILKEIIPEYRKFQDSGQIELSVTPYYHPILPLLCNTRIAAEANNKTILPKVNFSFPQDAKVQIGQAMEFYRDKFQCPALGMWPSEEAVSEHILPFIIQAGINWIVADEAILFKSLKIKKRDTKILYQPHSLRRKDGVLNIVFRDRNLSDLIGFVYHKWSAVDAVNDFMRHLKNTANAFVGEDVLLTVAMDGENAWEYYTRDGHDFLNLLYREISNADFVRTTTVSEYLKEHPVKKEIKHLSAGSWIYGEFGKWIGNPTKVKAWEYLAKARIELERLREKNEPISELALKQMYICEGSDWFWWFGEGQMEFDKLFRMHLSNFYTLINKDIPAYLLGPL